MPGDLRGITRIPKKGRALKIKARPFRFVHGKVLYSIRQQMHEQAGNPVGADIIRPQKRRDTIAGKPTKSTCYKRAVNNRPYNTERCLCALKMLVSDQSAFAHRAVFQQDHWPSASSAAIYFSMYAPTMGAASTVPSRPMRRVVGTDSTARKSSNPSGPSRTG